MIFKKNALLLVTLFTTVLGAGFLFFSSFDATPVSNPAIAIESPEEEPELLFGLPLENYLVEEQVVARNEFLSGILQRYNVDQATITTIVQHSRPVFDVRKISAGNKYTVFREAGEPSKTAYFVYQPNQIDYIVYDLRDSVRVYAAKKEVETRLETAAGIIHQSLYETLQHQHASPELAVQLAEIYGWAVNFYRIRNGDWFKLEYERQYVEGEPVGQGKIISAVFSHENKEYQAYYFRPDSTQPGQYYDESGKSLRRSFLKAPLKFSRISSRYSLRRFHPVQRVWKAHFGTDFAAPHGTPIIATGSGTIVESAYNGGNGNYVKIKHNDTYTTQYLHMSKRAVKKGQQVTQGQVIGYVGSTGLATGPHVCYRFWKNGKQVDALRQQFPPSEPIADRYREAFQHEIGYKQQLLARLDVNAPLQEEKLLAFYDTVQPRLKPLFPNMLFSASSETEAQLVRHNELNNWL